MNKKTIKETFDKNLNINIVHDELIKKIEKRNSSINKRLVFIPITVILLGFMSIYLLLPNEQLEYKNEDTKNRDDTIKINVIEDDARYQEALDIDGRQVEKRKEELVSLFPFISNIKVPSTLSSNIKMTEEYASSNLKNIELYNQVIGYQLNYLEEDYETYENYQSISIFFSKTNKKRGRCIQIIEKDLRDSIINNTYVKISKYIDKYVVFFKYQEIYFDIETKNIQKEEVIELIRSIVNND